MKRLALVASLACLFSLAAASAFAQDRHDLSIQMRTLTAPWQVGEQGTFELWVSNRGNPIRRQAFVEVEVWLPTALSAATSRIEARAWDCTVRGQRLSCSWTGAPPIPEGNLEPIVLSVRADQETREETCATVRLSGRGLQPDIDAANNRSCATVLVAAKPPPPRRPDMAVTLRPLPGPWHVGEHGTLELSVTNLGGPVRHQAFLDVELWLPPGLSAVQGRIQARAWDCAARGQRITCGWTGHPPIPEGDLEAILISVLADQESRGQTCASVRLSGRGFPPEIDEANNESCVRVRVAARPAPPWQPDLAITQRALQTPWQVGHNGLLELHVTNRGAELGVPAALFVALRLPPGLTPQRVVPTDQRWQCTMARQDLSCEWRDPRMVPRGALPPIQLGVRATARPPGPSCVSVEVRGPRAGPGAGRTESCLDIPVVAAAAPVPQPVPACNCRGYPKTTTVCGEIVTTPWPDHVTYMCTVGGWIEQ